MAKTLEEYMALQYPIKLEPRENGSFFATHPDLQGCMAQGATADEAVRNLTDSKELWIEVRLCNGYSIPEPAPSEYSGRLQLRMSPRLHAGLAAAAENEDVSLNQLIVSALSQYLGAGMVQAQILAEIRRAAERPSSSIKLKRQTGGQEQGAPAIGEHDAALPRSDSRKSRKFDPSGKEWQRVRPKNRLLGETDRQRATRPRAAAN